MNASSREASGRPVAARSADGVSRAMTFPSRRNASRSQWVASSIVWLETMMVVPDSAIRLNLSQKTARTSGSSPTVGSSRSSRAGRWTRAIARLTRYRMPPLRLTIVSELRGASPTRAIASSTDRPREARSDIPYIRAKKSTFSLTESSWYRALSWGM